MKKILVATVLAIGLASAGFAYAQGGDGGNGDSFLNKETYRGVMQNPTLTHPEGSGVFTRSPGPNVTTIRDESPQNPTLTLSEGSGAFPARSHNLDENYGIAPAWGITPEVRMGNPSLQGVFENIE